MKDYIISKLKEMGFDESRIARGIEATKCESLDQVMDWIINDCEREDNSAAFIEDDDCQVIDDQPVQAQNLNQPAESSEQGQGQGQEKTMIKKELSEEEKEMEKKRLEEKIKQRRAEREAKERTEEIEREKNRRKTGSEISKMREEMERQEQIRLAQELRKRKLEKLQEKQAVLEQIKKDREAMKKDNQPNLISPQLNPQPQPGSSYSASSSNECRLKIRLPNSQVLSHTFSANEQLAAVRLYVQTNRSDMDHCPSNRFQPFTFMFPPNTIYTNDDMDKTLLELGLCPSARLIVSDLKR